jgi:fructokinase
MRSGNAIKAIAFGEILWDIIDGKAHIGGAPFNLAAHIACLGGDAAIVSALGNDELGKKAVDAVSGLDIRTDYINMKSSYPTGTVKVTLDEAGKPEYEIVEPVAWDAINPSDSMAADIEKKSWDLFVFGTLAQRSELNRKSLKIVGRAAGAKEIFFDVNLRLQYYSEEIIRESLKMTTILKLNDEEVSVVASLLWKEKMEEEQFCTRIFEDFPVKMVCITRGKEGSSLYKGGERFDEPVVDVEVKDTVGAGDSFSAAFLTAYLKGENPQAALRFASRLSSFVAGSNGAIPPYEGWILPDVKRIQAL